MSSNSDRTDHQSQQTLQEMLMKLREISNARHSASELEQLTKEIDDAIIYSNDVVVKRALQKIGLSSEEMISLLRESKAHINELNNIE